MKGRKKMIFRIILGLVILCGISGGIYVFFRNIIYLMKKMFMCKEKYWKD